MQSIRSTRPGPSTTLDVKTYQRCTGIEAIDLEIGGFGHEGETPASKPAEAIVATKELYGHVVACLSLTDQGIDR